MVVNDFEVLKEEGLATPEQGCWDSFEIQNAVPSHVQPEEAVISCTWREVLGAFKDFEPGRRRLALADTFKLEFRVKENDNDTGWVEKIANVGSDGTDILVKAMVNIMLINVWTLQS